MKKFTAIVLFISLTVQLCAQFNPLQTQYMRNPLVINPACAGEQGYMSSTLSARRQWMGFNGAPETFVFTLHSPVRTLHHNVGLLAAQDNIAVIHRTQLRAYYAYRIVGRKVSFAAGIAPGVSFISNRWNDVSTNSSGDASFQGNTQVTQFEIGYGVYLSSKHFFVGVSSQVVMNKSQESVVEDQPFLLYTGVIFGNAKKLSCTVSTLGRYMLSGYYQADVNISFILRNQFGFGLSYRHQDAVAAMVSFRITEQFQLGYAYDYTISNLQKYSSGSHELMLRYDFGFTVNRKSPRRI
ncbi:MAG TPA: PorP/SprF family type IX secretion system membrane protein [Bacteroidia bacterium]|nr:PorP/SprF family type IX secretion system membrane protein [Bacteroidia bacterium]